ncbi:MAG: hypothetical protein Q9221_004100 [Calogaya cf. arnoldii]
MNEHDNVNDVINPFTALAFVKDQSGTVSLLLAGEGPYLKVLDHGSGHHLTTTRIFETQATHGIIVINASDVLDGLTDLLIWGGRRVRVGLLRHGPAAVSSRIEIELKEELTLDDWILDACFNPTAIVHHFKGSISPEHDAVVLTAHNVAYAICQDQEQQPSCKQIVAGPESMLYSAHIEWTKQGKILAASGTVFGEIFLWSFADSAVRADADPPAASQLHHKMTGHEGSVFGVSISPDLSEHGLGDVKCLLASCSDDRTIRLWDISFLETGATFSDLGSQHHESPTLPADKGQQSISLTGYVAMIMGHASRIWDVRFLTSSHEIFVLSFGEDSTTQVWQLNRDEDRSSLSDVLLLSHKQTYAYHSGKSIWANAIIQRQNGTQTVCTGGADGRIVLYDVLDKHDSTEGQVLTSKWTMRDIAMQLGNRQVSLGDDVAVSPPAPKKTLCEHVFDLLVGTWTIERHIKSALPTGPSGTFSGEARFDSRDPTAPEFDKEYLYIENGKFTTDHGLTFTATRRYVYRYQRVSDLMSSWFVKPDDHVVVDYLFHEIRLDHANNLSTHDNLHADGVIEASSYHLCVKDHYTPTYVLHLLDGHLQDWKLTYRVKGPQKDYVALASYARKDSSSSHSTGDMKPSTVTQATKPSRQPSPKPRIEEDSLRSYVFLANNAFLVTTAQGKVLVGSLLLSASDKLEAGQGVAAKSPVKWKMVGQYEVLRSSSIAIDAINSNLILLSGNDGTISFYDRSTDKISPLLHLKRKLAFIYAQKLHAGHPEIHVHLVLAICLGIPIANVYELNDNDLRNKDIARQSIKLSLPPCFVVTSSCYLSQLRIWVLGSRNGVVAIYNQSTAQHDSELKPCSIVTDVHGQDAITVIQCSPHDNKTQTSYVLTAGRDGHFAVHEITITTARTSTGEDLITLRTVHRSTPPFGPNIEGATLDRRTRDLILWGFRSKEFVVWNASKDMETINVDCGGAHRNWCYHPRNDGSDGGAFVWTKASVCHVHSQSEASHKILSSGGHGREIKAMATSPILAEGNGAKVQYIATGAEDTTMRIWSYNGPPDKLGSAFRCLGTFGKHTTGIQQLRWSADGSLLFSAAGCEELFVWRIQPVPFLGVGAVCEAICPKVTDDGDLRVMDFAIAEVSCSPKDGQNSTEKGYIVNVVYSDSSLRVSSLFFQ